MHIAIMLYKAELQPARPATITCCSYIPSAFHVSSSVSEDKKPVRLQGDGLPTVLHHCATAACLASSGSLPRYVTKAAANRELLGSCCRTCVKFATCTTCYDCDLLQRYVLARADSTGADCFVI